MFIVDEASMLANGSSDGAIFGSGALLDDLVSYVRGGKGCRLILVGDDAQLPPIGVDYSPALDPKALSVYGEVIYTSLDEVVRQEPNRVFCSTPPWYAACWRTVSAKYRDSGWISLISRW